MVGDINLINGTNDEFNSWLFSLQLDSERSEVFKKSLVFFRDYFDASVKKLISLGYDELFVDGKDPKKEEVRVNSEVQSTLKILSGEMVDFINKKIGQEGMQPFSREELSSLDSDQLRNYVSMYLESPEYKRLVNNDFSTDDYDMLKESVSDLLFSYIHNENFKPDRETAVFLAKYNRFLNLEAKLAHTSRMTYMTMKTTRDMKDPMLRELTLLSVMYHDIGRFYQAVYYPDFADKTVKETEGNSLLDSHGPVGYYFPIQNIITQDLIRCSNNMDETLLIHSLMSIVTKLHQKGNVELSHYEHLYDGVEITPETVDALNGVLKKAYEEADEITFSAKFDVLGNVKFMEEFNKDKAVSIMKSILYVSDVRKKGDIDNPENAEIVQRINEILSNYYDPELLEQLYETPELLNDKSYLEKLFGLEVPQNYDVRNVIKSKDGTSARFDEIATKMLRVDYAKVLDGLISGENDYEIEAKPEVLDVLRKMMSAAMTITTDMDKLDIFNQRINGSWEKTNGSVSTETADRAIDSVSINAFYSDELNRDRGDSIRFGASRNPNRSSKIKAFWWQLDQFVTVNLRNYSSFEFLKENNQLEVLRQRMISLQDADKVEGLTPLINEPIAFASMFVDAALGSRVGVDGKIIPPSFVKGEDETYQCIVVDDSLPKPSLFTTENISVLRATVRKNFQELYQFDPVTNRPTVPIGGDSLGSQK